jgi:hypothetical protein
MANGVCITRECARDRADLYLKEKTKKKIFFLSFLLSLLLSVVLFYLSFFPLALSRCHICMGGKGQMPTISNTLDPHADNSNQRQVQQTQKSNARLE